MPRNCPLTHKKPMVGNRVSHANNKTKRRFDINLRNHRFWSQAQGRFIRVRVTTSAIRLIDKIGFDEAWALISKS